MRRPTWPFDAPTGEGVSVPFRHAWRLSTATSFQHTTIMAKSSSLGLTDRLSPRWARALLVIFVVIALLAVAQFGVLRRWEGSGLAVAAPALVMVLVLLRERRLESPGLIPMVCVAALCAVAAESQLLQSLAPAEPLATSTLARGGPLVRLDVRPGTTDLALRARAHLDQSARNVEGDASVEVRQANHHQIKSLHFSRFRPRWRKRAPAVQRAEQDVDQVPLDLAGSGPIELRLLQTRGSIGRSLDVSIHPALRGQHAVRVILLALLGLALLIEVAVRPRNRFPVFAGAIGLVAVLGYVLPTRLETSDALDAVLSGLMLAVVLGFGGGALGAMLARRVLGGLHR